MTVGLIVSEMNMCHSTYVCQARIKYHVKSDCYLSKYFIFFYLFNNCNTHVELPCICGCSLVCAPCLFVCAIIFMFTIMSVYAYTYVLSSVSVFVFVCK